MGLQPEKSLFLRILDQKSRIFSNIIILSTKLRQQTFWIIYIVCKPLLDIFIVYVSLISTRTWNCSLVVINISEKYRISVKKTMEPVRGLKVKEKSLKFLSIKETDKTL